MADLYGALQKAVFDRLTDQISGAKVYEHPPENVARPLVLIAGIAGRSLSGKDGTIDQAGFAIQSENKAAGLAALSALRAQVRTALTDWQPPVTNGVQIGRIRLVSGDAALRFEDEDVYYGLDRFQAILQPAD